MNLFQRLRPLVLLLLFTLISIVAVAQQSAQINYQGVARKADGSPVAEQAITLRLSIHDGGALSPVVYSETRALITNKFGLFTTVIGSPGPSSQTGSMNAVAWSTGNKFLQVELDPDGGNNFQNLGTSQLQSVPYAVYANQASPVGNAGGDLSGTYPNPTVGRIQGSPVSATAPQSGQILRWNGSSWTPADVSGPSGPVITIAATAPLNASTAGGNTSLSLDKSNASTDGYLSRTDWLLFNEKPSKGYVDNAVGGVSSTLATESTRALAAEALKENIQNKSTNLSTDGASDQKYPSARSVKTYVDASLAGFIVPDANADIKGVLKLAGDLGGTAAVPLIADGKITTVKVAEGAITDGKIASGISASKVGLGNVNNTSDAAKPVSTATQAALDARELLTNKSLNISVDAASDEKYPSVKSVKAYVDAVTPAATPDADGTLKGKIQLAGDLTGTSASPVIADGKITTAKIADGAVTDAKIAPGISPSKIGLGNVNNTSDAAKPVSTATQTALDARELLSNKSVNLLTDAASDTKYPSVKSVKTYVDGAVTGAVADADATTKGKLQLAGDLAGTAAAPVIANGKITTAKIADGSITDAKIATGISASKVGLGNVDNTSDSAKPISTATQAALDLKGGTADLALKAPLASPAFTGTVSGITKAMVGLGDVENTTDLGKPVSTATLTALNTRELTANKSTDVAADAASDTKYPSVKSVKTYVDAASSTSSTALATEVTRATTAEGVLTTNLASEVTRATAAEGTLTTNLAAEVTRATTAEATKEALANKSTDVAADAASDTKYPSVKSVKTYVDAAITAATPDADATTKGKIQLAGDLGGSAASPVIVAGAITDAKIASGAAIADTKLATISTAGKVANTATTATSANTASAIIARDGSGNFSAGTVTATLTGTASIATNIAGGSVGLIPYQSSANTTALLAVGTAGYVLQSNGAAAPTWVPAATVVREIADEATATAAQTSFTLTQTPSANSRVKMFVNGIRISNTAYSSASTTLTYVPANNGGYSLAAGDRIQFDYYY